MWTKINTFKILEGLQEGDLLNIDPENNSNERIIVKLEETCGDEIGKVYLKGKNNTEIEPLTHFDILSDKWWVERTS